MSITNTTLSTVISNVYVSSGNTVISAAYFCNFGANTNAFTVYAVPTGSTASTNNIIYNTIQLASGDTYVMDWEKLVLGNGDSLRANAVGNISITATISYIGV
jgi:hypothetical protein